MFTGPQNEKQGCSPKIKVGRPRKWEMLSTLHYVYIGNINIPSLYVTVDR